MTTYASENLRLHMKSMRVGIACLLLAVLFIMLTPAQTEANGQPRSADNETMMQYFEWYLSEEGAHWNRLAADAPNLAQVGIRSVWIPPAYKGAFGTVDVGYGIYDLYDLGEFDQKGTVRTKYGTKAQLKRAVERLQANGVKVYADIVMNHKAGGDALETVTVTEVQGSNRLREVTAPYKTDVWSTFQFPGRNGKYSTFTWDASHFDGIDRDKTGATNKIYKFAGKTWDSEVESTYGNYDYLMFADLDYDNQVVVDEMKKWGAWYVNELGLDGFRLDAVKHVKFDFMREWLDSVRKETGKPLFAVGEYWSHSTAAITNFHNKMNQNMSMFDVDLHYRMYDASIRGGAYDMRNLLNGTLSMLRPQHAVTFVDNHDTQPGQSLFSFVDGRFKQQAYALILTRQEGIPTVFYGDYYGIPNNQIASSKNQLDLLLKARKDYAYGKQFDYINDPDVIGWTRTGESGRPDSGLATLITDGKAGNKRMFVGTEHAGEVWRDITGNRSDRITIEADGFATFHVNANSVSVYVKEFAPTVDTIAPQAVPHVLLAGKNEQSATLSWFAASDNVGVTSYDILRNGVKVGSTSSNYFTDRGLTASTIYQYQVVALDAASNRSANSSTLTLRTAEAPPQNQVTIYYKKGFAAPFIHYRPAGGTWTTAPGVRMLQAEHPDYMKLTVSMNLASHLEACFNNGSGMWDSNGGRNYMFLPGVSTYLPGANGSPGTISRGAPAVLPPDLSAPSIPQSLTASELTSNAVTLRWQPATDNVAVRSYQVLRNGTSLTSVSEPMYRDKGLQESTKYEYTIVAFDAAGNRSVETPKLSVTTIASQGLNRKVTVYYKAGLQTPYIHYRTADGPWSASPGVKMESSEISGYFVTTLEIGDAASIEAVFNNGATMWDNNHDADYLIPHGTWTFTPSESVGSGVLSEGVPKLPVVDVTPPSIPGQVETLDISDQSVRLKWSASSDNDAVSHYEITLNGIKFAEVRHPLQSYVITGLMPSTTYILTTRAVDASANRSPESANITVTTLAPPKPNEVTIYYKHGFSEPNIQYRPQNGNWTTGPGVKMLSAEMPGYSIIKINIGAANKFEAAFNDGNGLWDNNNGLNYLFDSGTFTYVAPSIVGNPGTIVPGVPVIPVPDQTPPTTPTNLAVSLFNTTSAKLTWTASTDNVGVTGYLIYRNKLLMTTLNGANSADTISFIDEALTPGNDYFYSVIAFDKAKNYSPSNPIVKLSTPLPPLPPDTTNNKITIYYKKGFATPYIHYRSENSEWTKAPGVRMLDSEIPGYAVAVISIGKDTQLEACFNNGAGMWDSNGNKNYFFMLGEYTYTPTGIIQSGAPEKPKPDTSAPTIPQSLSVANKTEQTVRLTWSAAIDNVAVAGYDIYRDGAKVATVRGATQWQDSNLKLLTTYRYFVRAFDAAGNVSEASSTVTVVTNQAPPARTVTIYYKRGFAPVNIHYRPAGGTWTATPGVAMQTAEVNGYSKITIQIGAATRLEACFNNGKGVWDSNNGRNYLFEEGVSTYLPAADGRSAGRIVRGIPN